MPSRASAVCRKRKRYIISNETEQITDDPDTLIRTNYKIGQDNIQANLGPFGLDIHNPVFVISGLTIVAFVFFTLALPEQAGALFGWVGPTPSPTTPIPDGSPCCSPPAWASG